VPDKGPRSSDHPRSDAPELRRSQNGTKGLFVGEGTRGGGQFTNKGSLRSPLPPPGSGSRAPVCPPPLSPSLSPPPPVSRGPLPFHPLPLCRHRCAFGPSIIDRRHKDSGVAVRVPGCLVSGYSAISVPPPPLLSLSTARMPRDLFFGSASKFYTCLV